MNRHARRLITILSGGGPSDTVAPTCTITCAQSPGPTTTSPLNMTFTFSEVVIGFVIGDITVGNGTKGNFAGSGAVYTCDVTPSSPSITVTVDVGAGVCTDAAGNGNTAATQVSIHYTSLTTSLIGYWKLEEAAASDRLDSVGSRTLAPQNTVGQTTGKFGNCATFATGAANHLLTAADATLTAIDWSLGFSVCGWIRIPAAFTARSCVMAKQSGGTLNWALFADSISSLRFEVVDSVSGNSVGIDTTTMSVDTWYYFQGRYNSSTKKAEFRVNNGTWRIATNALTNAPRNDLNRLAVNRYGASYGDTWVDEVGLWTRYLSDAEMDALYNGGTGNQYPF